ncbi:MAG TPA: MFS transporter [Fimbriimonadaceae bacterium]|nr:MFS transporter [Fimbriimonadaceae bacterium]HRJ33929.1 MFS transporter [Fimbriimonadaceae bacterium]
MTGHQNRTTWYAGLSSYWFASSFKWFILLVAVLPGQVKDIVPGGEKSAYWGGVFMIGAVWALIGPALFGYISDSISTKYGIRRPFLAIGAGLTLVALAVLAQAPSIAVLTVGYLLLQISDDIGTGPYGAVIPDLVPEENRGRASGWMGVMQLSAQIASAITGLILGNVLLIYLAIGVVNVLGAIWVLWALKDCDKPIQRTDSKPTFRGLVQGWLEPWKSMDFRWVWFTRFLNAFGFYLIQPYLRFYLEDMIQSFVLFGFRIGDPVKPSEAASSAAIILALTISLTGALGAAWAMSATDRLGRKKVIYLSGTVMALVLVPFAFARSFDVIWILAVVFGFGYGAYLSADWALASDVMPNKESVGKDMGVWTSSVTSVQIFAGGMGTVITLLNRSSMGLGYVSAILTAAVSFFIGTILVKKVRGST